MYPIHQYGSEEQEQQWLPGLVRGEKIGCFGLTEADHGSDPGGMVTRAVKDGESYILNGSKIRSTPTKAPTTSTFSSWTKRSRASPRFVEAK